MIFAVGGVLGQNVLDNLVIKEIKEVESVIYGDCVLYVGWDCMPGSRRVNTEQKKIKRFAIVNIKKQYTNYFLPNEKLPRRQSFKLLQEKPAILIPQTIITIPQNFYTQNFGFFCKKEVQLQKAIKVPFVFRLGSVEMCDRLEGKGR